MLHCWRQVQSLRRPVESSSRVPLCINIRSFVKHIQASLDLQGSAAVPVTSSDGGIAVLLYGMLGADESDSKLVDSGGESGMNES